MGIFAWMNGKKSNLMDAEDDLRRFFAQRNLDLEELHLELGHQMKTEKGYKLA